MGFPWGRDKQNGVTSRQLIDDKTVIFFSSFLEVVKLSFRNMVNLQWERIHSVVDTQSCGELLCFKIPGKKF